jgi:hypothetical protein
MNLPIRNGSIIPGATDARYVITNAHPSQAGSYHVAVANGIDAEFSALATLTLTTQPSAPSILMAPMDAEVYSNQTARFEVTACAFPLASYQWLSNGLPLVGATERILVVPGVTPAMSGTEYCVRMTNTLGMNTACARLTVTPKPRLRITEVMARANSNCVQHADWFELTNFDTFTVNLRGYRFSDRFSLVSPGVITPTVMLQPGQSAILVEGLTPEAFRQWWGAGNLPPGLTIITYTGLGFSEAGDQLYLWNAAASDPDDWVDSRSFAASVAGVSQRFGSEEWDCYFGCDNGVSEWGAFRAVECGDIGSPGYTTNGPPRLVSVTFEAPGARLTWHGIEGRRYRLESNGTVGPAGWQPVGEITAADSLPALTDPSAARTGQRFYRVVELAP